MTQELIRKASKGDKDAMIALYNEQKSQVLCLCQSLLLDENEADHATAQIFKKVWAEVICGRVTSDAEFGKLVIRKTVMYCKAKMLQKNSRAFRVPMNSNFAVSYDTERMIFRGSAQKIILHNLPTFHRFIYVLHTAADYSAVEIARIFGTTPKTINNALCAECTNIDRIAAAASLKMKMTVPITVGAFHDKLLEDAAALSVPAAIDAAVKMNITEICGPIQKREKQKQIGIIAAVAVILVFIAILIAAPMLGGNDGDIDLDNADPDAVVSADADAADSTADTDETQNDGTAAAEVEVAATHYADITIENYGTITVALDGNAAPETVANFVSLAESGFYDGLTFHRIKEGFVMQGGDPNGDGTGGNTDADGNEVTITGEFSANGFENDLSHTRGAISMARANDYNSASSQFFIVHEDNTESLDGLYACFGYVTEGMDIVDTICESAQPTDSSGTIPAEAQPIITSIVITEVDTLSVNEELAGT